MKKVVHLICAARPNFMKVAPLYHALVKTDWCEPVIVWVRQHTDSAMAHDFFQQFDLPVISEAQAFRSYDSALCELGRPAAVIVPGDVNASADSALTAARRGIPVVHLEAGLRSFDRSMPEEVNRIVIDSVSDLLLTPSYDADANLVPLRDSQDCTVECVGNIMIDTFEMLREKIEAVPIREDLYAVVTLHRPSNVDDPGELIELLDQIRGVADLLPVVFPVHPRTCKQLPNHFIRSASFANIDLRNPMPYVEFMALVKKATIVITDSGGIQEETSYLGVPCATVRENTERPVTVYRGTNALIKPHEIAESARYALAGQWKTGLPIPLWDGKTADRCVTALHKFLNK